MRYSTSLFRSAMVAGSVIALATAQHAVAQDESEADTARGDDIIVTGTQLRGVAPVGSSMIGVDRTQMLETGLATTADILKTVPQVSSLGPGEATLGTNVNSATLNTTRANGLNLRGLGSQATLTLLDGRRVPPSGIAGQLFDASAIPAIALQRVDIVADGASATYGSDAVAGVANLILRSGFDGLEMSGRYGLADDYSEYQISGIFGSDWGSGSVMVSGDYYWHSRLRKEDRADLFPCDLTPFGGVNGCTFSGSPGNVTDPNTGIRYGLPGGSGEGLTPGDLSATPNYGDSVTGYDLLPETERWTVIGKLEQDITPDVKAWFSGFLSKRKINQRSGPLMMSSATPVPSSNPWFIDFGGGATSQVVEYSFYDDYGATWSYATEQVYQLAAGLDWDVGGDWRISAHASHGETEAESPAYSLINNGLLLQALADPNPATSLNVYGSGGNNTRAQVESFLGFFKPTGLYQIDLVNVKADGPLFSTGGGEVRLAVGGEYHHDYYLNQAFENISTPSLNQINLFGDADSSRDVWSAFAEVNVPLVGDGNARPGLNRLELNAAVRYDSYSDAGETTNPKFGVRYDPVDGVSFNASYGTSFRAPTLSDSNPASTATVFSLPNFGPFGNVIEYVGGNANLSPEEATTWSVGVQIDPPNTGFRASLNYFNIDYRGLIDTAPVFSPQAFTDPGYAPFVIFNPTIEQVNAIYSLPWAPPPLIAAADVDIIVDARRNNIGQIRMDGLDFSANYEIPAGGGSIDLGVTGTYLFNYKKAVTFASPLLDQLNRVNSPLKFRGRANIGWRSESFSAILFANYTNAYENYVGTIAPVQDVDAYTTFDLNLSYSFRSDSAILSGTRVSVNALNLFDAEPPFAAVAPAQIYDSTVGNPLGRMISFSVHKAF